MLVLKDLFISPQNNLMKLYFKIFLIVLFLTLLRGGIFYFVSNLEAESSTPITSLTSSTTGDLNNIKTVTFLAVGDIMLSRDVATKMSAQEKDGNYPFINISKLLSSTDFNFGNLESPFSGTDTQDQDPNTFTFNAPTYAITGLTKNNFRVLNLANNHALNQGKEGLIFTKKYLLDNSITSIGAGSNKEESWAGTVYQAKTGEDEIKIGFVGATYGPTSNYLAQISELSYLQKEVKRLKLESDFVVVTMHAGTEYERKPNSAQTKFAHAAIDAGADMVIGAHPHWVQPYEKYKDKYIFYSLGNFVFDQDWSQDTKEGLTLKVSLTKLEEQTTLKQIDLIPIIIERSHQPRVATELEKLNILKKINVATETLK